MREEDGSGGITITPRKIILWGAVVGAIVTISGAAYAIAAGLDGRYLLRLTGERWQVSNCVRSNTSRQEKVEDEIFRLETLKDAAARDRKLQFSPADAQNLQRWYSQRKTEDDIKRRCIEETKEQ